MCDGFKKDSMEMHGGDALYWLQSAGLVEFFVSFRDAIWLVCEELAEQHTNIVYSRSFERTGRKHARPLQAFESEDLRRPSWWLVEETGVTCID